MQWKSIFEMMLFNIFDNRIHSSYNEIMLLAHSFPLSFHIVSQARKHYPIPRQILYRKSHYIIHFLHYILSHKYLYKSNHRIVFLNTYPISKRNGQWLYKCFQLADLNNLYSNQLMYIFDFYKYNTIS